MYSTVLITGIGEYLGYCLQYTEVFIADNKVDVRKAAFLEPYKESMPAVFILFHAFSGTDDLSATVFINTNGNVNRNILDIITLALFEIGTINVNIRILLGNSVCTLLPDMSISFLVKIAYSSGRYFGSPEYFGDIFYRVHGYIRSGLLPQRIPCGGNVR